MHTLTQASMPWKLFGAVLAIVALMVTALAITWSTPIQAQNATNTYDDPQPCGPGQMFPDEPSGNAVAQITTGHYALFDGYWHSEPDANDDDPNARTLNNNLCPPKVTHSETDDGFGNVSRTFTRSASNIDIRETVVHIGDEYKAGVVATSADATNGELALDKYPEVRTGLGLSESAPVPADTQVYWVRLDDPATADIDEDADLILGFSTILFDADYWHYVDEDGNDKPFQYEFEAERERGVDTEDVPHLFTYREEESGRPGVEVVWNTAATNTKPMSIEAGWFEHLQWVFTKPGTYVLTVQLKGHVRQSEPDGWNEAEDGVWKPLTKKTTVTSVPQQYTFHVGSLEVNEPPRFSALERSVPENSPVGTPVGSLIPVVNPDDDPLQFGITGDGAEKFTLAPVESPSGMYLQVSGLGELDHEAQNSYDLTLTVSDNRDHEGNPDSVIDDTVGIRVNVSDVAFGFKVSLDVVNPEPGQVNPLPEDAVRVTVSLLDPPDDAILGTLDMRLEELGTNNLNSVLERDTSRPWTWVTDVAVSNDTPGTRTFRAHLTYDAKDPNSSDETLFRKTESHDFSITWQNPG